MVSPSPISHLNSRPLVVLHMKRVTTLIRIHLELSRYKKLTRSVAINSLIHTSKCLYLFYFFNFDESSFTL